MNLNLVVVEYIVYVTNHVKENVTNRPRLLYDMRALAKLSYLHIKRIGIRLCTIFQNFS